ncbi:MAG: DUF4349 domain-containing protein [Chitinophagales bacterium]
MKTIFARKAFLPVFIMLLITSACRNGNVQTADDAAVTLQEMSNTESRASVLPADRMLEMTAELEFETHDPKADRKKIFAALHICGGYAENDETKNAPPQMRTNLVLRIPSDSFEIFLKDITEGIEKFDRREVHVEDVTDVYADLDSRLHAKKEMENRYLQLLEQAKTVPDMLEIEKQIGILRADIEAMEGRIQNIQKDVHWATVDITYYQVTEKRSLFGERFNRGLQSGWNNLLRFLIGLSYGWPFIVIGVLFFFFMRRRIRFKQNKLTGIK